MTRRDACKTTCLRDRGDAAAAVALIRQTERERRSDAVSAAGAAAAAVPLDAARSVHLSGPGAHVSWPRNY